MLIIVKPQINFDRDMISINAHYVLIGDQKYSYIIIIIINVFFKYDM